MKLFIYSGASFVSCFLPRMITQVCFAIQMLSNSTERVFIDIVTNYDTALTCRYISAPGRKDRP